MAAMHGKKGLFYGKEEWQPKLNLVYRKTQKIPSEAQSRQEDLNIPLIIIPKNVSFIYSESITNPDSHEFQTRLRNQKSS